MGEEAWEGDGHCRRHHPPAGQGRHWDQCGPQLPQGLGRGLGGAGLPQAGLGRRERQRRPHAGGQGH
eukprot:5276221-Alexandrium_andersonii.AAC.1